MMKKVLAASALLLPLSLVGSQANAGMLNDFQALLTGSSSLTLTNSLNVADELFGVLFVATCCLNIARGAMKNHSLDGWAWTLGETFYAMIGPLAVLNGARLILPTLAGFIGTLAGQITGEPGYAGGPDAVVGIGVGIAAKIIQASVPANPLEIINPLALLNMLFAASTASLVVMAFLWIGWEVLFSFVSALFIVSIGAAQVGWVAAPGTHHMAMRFTGGMVASVWRCVVILAWAALVGETATAWSATLLADINNPLTFLQGIAQMNGAAIVLAIGTSKVGNMGQSMFSGAPVLTAREIVATTGKTVATAVNAGRRVA
jgi:hypothetical protein